MWPRYFTCHKCLAHYRIEPLRPWLGSDFFHFCAVCGSSGDVVEFEIDRDLDMWYTIAEGLGLKPTAKGVELAKGLKELWDPQVHYRFGDFVRSVLEEHDAAAGA